MKSNTLLKTLLSVPTILIFLYFIPFIGVCLVITRYILYRKQNGLSFFKFLIVAGILMFIPKLIFELLNIISFNNEIVIKLKECVDSDIYLNLMNYGKRILSLGIILFIILMIIDKMINSAKSKFMSFYKEKEKQRIEISKANDLKIKQQQENARNTHVVYCPNCGASNMVIGKHSRCKYCRSHIEYKEKNQL